MENKITLNGKLILKGKIITETGLHIGGIAETLKIGGSDNPVIRDKNGRVFIPGSSLKGKIRSLLEVKDGKYKLNKGEAQPCNCGDCPICMLFGPHKSENIKEPARAIVRDAYLNKEKPVHEYLEIKPENVIDRVKGTAQHPRFIERVVAGSEFDYEVVFNIYDENRDKELIKKFIEGIKLLEDDYLGGSGSRGYGKIKFEKLTAIYRPKGYYEGIKNEIELATEKDDNNLDELIKLIDKINF
ncbi:type III-A CRISPR-associated RAMP protein Csm3 [Methanococcus aeolicus]|uniref:CRISPR system Cms endoribonuclease Csm3 n=1 Tax=Methanococcus aeolicus (strain ATCC BAA-1280 / DSM 17508 / OCM 812 / Nankai-3) TaxID=419665 RepID=A6UVY6_META3|nr:type III-A CRISPR-associated RAMP protein Csm3 [Methanococcus aeolicus]ABR56658.1 CRISPR-associated RAMP protein, Csm3 family [Methanococcus aeolicus Nankai-3]UXM84661.1 type III-A CRISPR-associated RAMP protein Csm3 [Methanococcus aeolicus]